MRIDTNTRRKFIKTISATFAGIVVGPHAFTNIPIPKARAEALCAFSKCLQFLDYYKLGETLASVGFDGVDLTVRKGGHVLPEKVKEDLPMAVKALSKSGIGVPMMVTGINNPEDPQTEQILGTASELGIKYYRMGSLMYNKGKSVKENLDLYKAVFEKLEKINGNSAFTDAIRIIPETELVHHYGIYTGC